MSHLYNPDGPHSSPNTDPISDMTTTNTETDTNLQDVRDAPPANAEATINPSTFSPTDASQKSSIHASNPSKHSILCRNIQRARNKGKDYRKLGDSYAARSAIDDARNEYINSLDVVKNYRLSIQDTEVCPGCVSGRFTATAWDSGEVREWYNDKVDTDVWALESKAAQSGITLT